MAETPPIPLPPEQELAQYNFGGYLRLGSRLIKRYSLDKPRYKESITNEFRKFSKSNTVETKLEFINLINKLIYSDLDITTFKYVGYHKGETIKITKPLEDYQIQVLELSFGLHNPNQAIPKDTEAAASINPQMTVKKFQIIRKNALGQIYNSSQFQDLLKFMHIDPASLDSLNAPAVK